MKMKKIYFMYGTFWIIAVICALFFVKMADIENQKTDSVMQSQYVKGRIIDIREGYYYVQVLEGERKIVKTELNDLFFHDDYKKGDSVSLYITRLENNESRFDIADYYHFDGLIVVFILFCGMAIWVAKKKGFYSILSVIFSLVFFYTIILNAIRVDFPLIPAGIIYVFLITILTIPLIHGFNKKGLSAIIAVNAGYAIGFAISYFFVAMVNIGATPSEEFRELLGQFPDVNISGILMLSLFLGAVGALIDVAVTICSAVFEAMREHPGMNFLKAYRLGMNVGKDIMGSMINTLLMAYLSASLPFLALMSLAKFSNAREFLNYDFVALELTRVFIGGASIILLIPITSAITAFLVAKNK